MTLSEFFLQNPSFAVAFSGGTDSSYLICSAKKAGVTVKGYYVKSAFQPQFEMKDALKLAREYSIDIEVIPIDILSNKIICENPSKRCYYCKKLIFSAILEKAKTDSFTLICDGTNASDDITNRPGIKALKELGIVSPLRLCGITKENVRCYSKQLGIFTADKPAYACLATRVATNQEISINLLEKIERCEDRLFKLGFSDFRVRVVGNCARLQITRADIPLFVNTQSQVSDILLEAFSDAVLDLKTVRD